MCGDLIHHEVFGDGLPNASDPVLPQSTEYLPFVYMREQSAIVLTDSRGVRGSGLRGREVNAGDA